MKKIILMLFLPIFVLAFFTGCTYKGYSGSHADLYTVAINSVLWNNGHSFSADRYTDPRIEIIDKDTYGRTMFMYHEKYYSGSDISFSSLIICQKSNDKEVFYYEDINYIVKEQILHTQNIEYFEDEEIEQLKAANDWNKEIDLHKCIKKEIAKEKPSVPNEQEIRNQIIDEFQLKSGEYSLFVHFLTSDSNNSSFIIYGYIWKNENEGTCFIGLVENNNQLNILVPSSAYDYKAEFIEFKKTSNWE